MVTSDDEVDDKTPEKVIEDLGGCGRYQMRMCAISHAMKTLIGWSILSTVITTKTPDFWCNDNVIPVNVTSEKDVNLTTQYDAHKSCVNVNDSYCSSFKFDSSVLRSVVSEFDLVCDYSFVPSTMMSIQSAGLLFGNLLTGQIADLFGRKKPFFCAVLLVTVADFVQLAANGWVLLAVCKFFVGVGGGAFMTTTYSLMSEFTLARHRVWVIGFPSWPIEASAFCLLAWLVREWRYMTLACGIVGIPCLLAWWVIPESFRWLLVHGRQLEAEKILDKIARHNGRPRVESKLLDDIVAVEKVEQVQERKYTILDMFRSKYMIRVSMFMAVNWFGLGFVNYGIAFGIQELSGNIYFNIFLFNIVGIPFKAIAIWTQNKFGRKFTSIFCYGGTALSCFIVAVVQNIDTDVKDSVTNGFALLANVGITMLWGSIQTMTVELYPTVIRNIGFGTLSVLGRFGAIIAPQAVFIGKLIGVPGFLYICCGFVSTMCVLALFGLSETKDTKLSDTIAGSKLADKKAVHEINETRMENEVSSSPERVPITRNDE